VAARTCTPPPGSRVTLFRPLNETETDLRTWASGDHSRIPTGFTFIDQLTQGGIAEGEVALLMAYSGVGKTAIGCNIAVNNRGIPTVFFSLEMQARFILKRLAAIHSTTSDRLIEQQLRAGEPCTPVQSLIEDFPHLGIVDKPAMSLKDMSSALYEAAEHWGRMPRLCILDYLELVGGIASLDAVNAVDKVSRKLKDFAREHDVAMVVLHQLNKSGDPHKPVNIKDARYGGNVAADYVIAAYRPCLDPDLSQHVYESRKRDLRLQFLKTRGGPDIHASGMQHDFDPETMTIRTVVLPQIVAAPSFVEEQF
jgi:replicative DNA helicase